MATFDKLPSGFSRVQVRLKGRAVSKTFLRESGVDAWAIQTGQVVETGKDPAAAQVDGKTKFREIVEPHIKGLQDVRKPLLRSKAACLEKLRHQLGHERLDARARERLIESGKVRAREGAGPVTLGIDLTYIRTLLVHAAAVHGINVPTDQVMLARVALNRFGSSL